MLILRGAKMYKFYNPNPCGKMVGDCVIRGISKVLNQTWEQTYNDITWQGFLMCDMPSSNVVWGAYLNQKGFVKKHTPYITVNEFCKEHPKGTYLLATGSHVIPVINGTFFDAWDSSKEAIDTYYEKEFYYE